MADEEVRGSVQGPNGERLQVQIGTKSFGVTVKDLLPLLLLIVVGALGYYRIITHDERLRAIDEHLQRLYEQQNSQRGDLQRSLLGQFEQQREQLRSQSELITSQSEQIRASLRENRELTGARMQNQDALLHAQTEEVRKQHAIILFNMTKDPSQHLTLDLPLPTERGR